MIKENLSNIVSNSPILEHAVFGKGRNTAGGAVAGASGEITANILSQALYNQSNPEKLTAEQKQQISKLSQIVGGLASGATSATSDSSSLAVAQNTQAGMQVAKNAVENNYLSNWQKTLRDKQLQECNGNIRCKLNTQLYWSSVDVEQDASFGTGVVASIPEGAIETFEGIANFAAHPIDTLNALSTLVKEGKLTETVKQSYLQRIDNLKTQYEKAGVSEAYNAGVETGKLLQETVGVLAGGAGVAKAGSKVVKELGSVAKSTISKNVSANNKLPVVGKTTGYENQTASIKVSTGAENIASYQKLKKSLAEQQQKGSEKVVKDLSKKPEGSVLMLPNYRHQLAKAKDSLPVNSKLRQEGNAAIAQINIDGLETKMLAGHSRINTPKGDFVGKGSTEFESLALPNKKGVFIDRKMDSEYKIFSNLADKLGSNTQATGKVTIFTERPACPSCLGIAEQFNKRYPNIEVKIFDNNGNVIKPKGEHK